MRIIIRIVMIDFFINRDRMKKIRDRIKIKDRIRIRDL